MRAWVFVLLLILPGCAAQPKPDEVQACVSEERVVSAIMKLREQGMDLVRERDEAIDARDTAKHRELECEAARKT